MGDWLILENGDLLNIGLITDVRFNERDGTATCWGYGVLLCPESKSVAAYFGKIKQGILSTASPIPIPSKEL